MASKQNTANLFGKLPDDCLSDSMPEVNERQLKIETLHEDWGAFSKKWEDYRKELRENWQKIDFIGKKVAKIADDDDSDDYHGSWSGPDSRDPSEYQGDNLADKNDGSANPGDSARYAEGIENGQVGRMSSDRQFKVIKGMALEKLAPDEIPAILHAGEAVLNRNQQGTLIGNMRNALSIGRDAASRVQSISISFGDLTLPNVTNASDFANALKMQFNPIMRQYFSGR